MVNFRGVVNRSLRGVGFGLILLGCWFMPVHAADLSVSATVDRSTIQLNQMFTITLELSGEKANRASVEPVFPVSLEQFARLVGRGGESTNMSWVNGNMTVSKTVRYQFQATKAGTFQVEPITVTVNGQNYQTKAFSIKIVDGGQAAQQTSPNTRSGATQTGPPPAEAVDGQDLFLKATVNKKSVYQNEPVIVSYKIYTRVNITSYGVDKLPNTAGFWQEEFELPQQPQLTDEVINGRRYRVAEIRKVALFPTASGKKTIEPLVVACDVRVQARRRSNDPFDSFFNDPFFSRTQRQQISTRPITIEVKPLPAENKPRKFYGAVGAYKLSASVDKQRVETNESIKLQVKISGTGNIQILPEPEVKLPDDFEVYGPTATEQISRTGASISGFRTLEYVLIPRYAGTHEIPAIEFSYFDLAKKSYRTLRTDPWRIEVNKGRNAFANSPGAVSRSEIHVLGQDIRYIQQRTPQFSPRGKYVHQSGGFLVLLILPLLGLMAAFVFQRRQDRMAGDIAYARERRANRVAVDRLRKAKKKNKLETQKEFYAEISRALLSFLANKLNIAEAGIITGSVKKQLRDRNISEKTIEMYFDCLATCDFQRFAPAQSEQNAMNKLYEEARNAITSLQKEL